MSGRRDRRLHGLSHEHHHALVLARRARLAEERGASDPEALWEDIQKEFARSILPHLVVEEERMLPPLRARGEGALVERTLRDHEELRRLIASSKPRLREFGEALFRHVRLEESELFDRAEERLTDAELDALERARPVIR